METKETIARHDTNGNATVRNDSTVQSESKLGYPPVRSIRKRIKRSQLHHSLQMRSITRKERDVGSIIVLINSREGHPTRNKLWLVPHLFVNADESHSERLRRSSFHNQTGPHVSPIWKTLKRRVSKNPTELETHCLVCKRIFSSSPFSLSKFLNLGNTRNKTSATLEWLLSAILLFTCQTPTGTTMSSSSSISEHKKLARDLNWISLRSTYQRAGCPSRYSVRPKWHKFIEIMFWWRENVNLKC